jgi:hypothetical protein
LYFLGICICICGTLRFTHAAFYCSNCAQDLFQLPPVSPSTTLPEVVVRHFVLKDEKLTKQDIKCAQLFSKFEKFELSLNMRARNDPRWADLIRRMRSYTPGDYTLRDHLRPVFDTLIATDADFMRDPAFLDAPILVTGNALRMAYILQNAATVARRAGVPLIRWRLPLSEDCTLTPEQQEQLYASSPMMWEYFIQVRRAVCEYVNVSGNFN